MTSIDVKSPFKFFCGFINRLHVPRYQNEEQFGRLFGTSQNGWTWKLKLYIWSDKMLHRISAKIYCILTSWWKWGVLRFFIHYHRHTNCNSIGTELQTNWADTPHVCGWILPWFISRTVFIIRPQHSATMACCYICHDVLEWQSGGSSLPSGQSRYPSHHVDRVTHTPISHWYLFELQTDHTSWTIINMATKTRFLTHLCLASSKVGQKILAKMKKTQTLMGYTNNRNFSRVPYLQFFCARRCVKMILICQV